MKRARPSGSVEATAPPDPLVTLARLRALARLLDAAVRVPGTSFRVGLDPLLGLIPGVGDLLGAGITAYLIWEARRLGASRAVLARMVANAGLDALVGAVPLAGDVFDAAFRANLRNVRLLEREVERLSRVGAGRWRRSARTASGRV